jgi:hypothetical protein
MTHKTVLGTWLLALICGFAAQPASGQDFVRLRNGKIVRCVVLRQDTTAIFTTDEAHRYIPQPPLQVFARDEVESIWLDRPPTAERHVPYRPHSSGMEAGGSLGFETWAETTQLRRNLFWMSLHGGFDISRELGIELDADVTLPGGKKSDVLWHRNKSAYQVLTNVIAHPLVVRGFVPFAAAGGGIAVGEPTGNVILTRYSDLRNVVDFALGVKWGFNGLGYRLEWRHHYYIWTPDRTVNGVRASEQNADASMIRATIFVYR